MTRSVCGKKLVVLVQELQVNISFLKEGGSALDGVLCQE
jgi:hypothetical protein